MRLVGSMTTLPGRLGDIVTPIKYILRQTVPLERLYLNIPLRTMKGDTYDIPEHFLNQFDGYKTKVVINRCTDYGPITKLAPTLDMETDPSTHIITFDDDIIVHRDLVKVLKSRIRVYPNVCWAFSGVCVGRFPFYFQFIVDNEKDQCVDWIQGVHVVAYRRSFFTTCDNLVKFRDSTPISNALVHHDDHHISLYLASMGILRVSIGKNIRDFLFKHKEGQEDALSGRPSMFREHYKIVRYGMKNGYYGTQCSIHTSIFYILIKGICIGLCLTLLLPRRIRGYLFVPVLVCATVATSKIVGAGLGLLQSNPLLLTRPQS